MPRKKKVNPRLNQLMIVTWLDAYLIHEVDDPSTLSPGCLMQTVGFLVKETDEQVSLAHERSLEDGTLRSVTTIHKSYIKEMVTVECTPQKS